MYLLCVPALARRDALLHVNLSYSDSLEIFLLAPGDEAVTMHCSTCLLVRSLMKFFGAFKNSQEDVSSEVLLSNQHCGREDSKGSWNRKHIRTSRKIDLRL